MLEKRGNIWDDFDKDHSILVVTTNGFIKRNGTCVMGRGIALEAARKFPSLPAELGSHIKSFGNRPFYFHHYGIVTMPVKHNWWEKADLDLIAQSAKTISEFAQYYANDVLVPRPGCGNGGLQWSQVKPAIEPFFGSDKYIVYTY